MTTRILFTALAFAIVLTACDTDDNAEPQDTSLTTVEEWNNADALLEATESVIDEFIDTRDSEDNCPVITYKQPRGNFPNTVTIDFGEACEGPHGQVRSGQIVIEMSASLDEASATRVITMVNFKVNEIALEGSSVITNQGYDEQNNVSFSRYSDLFFTFPGGATSNRTAEFFRTQIEGSSTPESIDDIFEITGSATGVNRFGVAYEGSIIEPLVKARDCRWYSDGIIDIQAQASTGIRGRTLDYSYPESTCDRLVEVQFHNGHVAIVEISRRWW